MQRHLHVFMVFSKIVLLAEDQGMPAIEFIRGEIERMRYQVQRQRGEIRQLQRAGISSTSAEAFA
jgi:hypothetical protein